MMSDKYHTQWYRQMGEKKTPEPIAGDCWPEKIEYPKPKGELMSDMDKFPEVIYLQIQDGYRLHSTGQISGDAIWCQEPILDTDVKYVRADVAEASATRATEAERKRVIEKIRGWYDEAENNGLINLASAYKVVADRLEYEDEK